jgi:hypothetical protein
MGIFWKEKIRLRHYQYRSPSQIQKRITIRKEARNSGYKYFGKDAVENWQDILK